MTPKRIFVLNGHPGTSSLCRALAERYANAARDAGHDVRVTHLSDLDFDMDFGTGSYENRKPLEPCLEKHVLQNMEWCGHMIVTAPLWWGGLPAKLKGLFDRTLEPGRTFDPRKRNILGMPTPVLVGRTARIVMTSDTPFWFLSLVYGRAIVRQLRGQIFGFIGFKRTNITWLAGASEPSQTHVAKWLNKLTDLGAAGG
ncbi:MAG: NAD(P)H-dependent oxidoreductase [Pseudomonadota bacterium]